MDANVLFQKISMPLPQKVFGLTPPLWEFQFGSTLPFKTLVLKPTIPSQRCVIHVFPVPAHHHHPIVIVC